MSAHKSLPRSFHRIRLELAREAGRPEGDPRTGYTLVAPIDAEGRLDADVAREFRDACVVVRFHPDRESERGALRRLPGGGWAFHYDFDSGAEDDDPGYRFDAHRFDLGEYITIIEDEGAHTYRVVSVEPV